MTASPRPNIVVIDHDGSITRILIDGLSDQVRIIGVTTIDEAELAMQREAVSVLVCRDDLPGETGIMFLTRHRDIPAWQRRILLCPPLNSDLTMLLINEANLFRCIAMPAEPALLVQHAEAALDESKRIKKLFAAETENAQLRQRLAANEARTPAALTVAWIKALPRLSAIALYTFVGIFALGTLTLISLYLLKTILGIDLFPDAHLRDAIK